MYKILHSLNFLDFNKDLQAKTVEKYTVYDSFFIGKFLFLAYDMTFLYDLIGCQNY